MSVDNYLGIYKVNNRKIEAHACFSECEEDCSSCNCRIIFTARSIAEAVRKAQEEMGSDIYEYGYMFKNI